MLLAYYSKLLTDKLPNEMRKMKAYVRIGAINQDVQLAEVPVPEMQPDQVLLKVEAFGVGIHDRYFIPIHANFPFVIGSEGAGIIIKTGSKVSDFSVGDRVIFTTILQSEGGSWAEYAVANQNVLTPLPDNLTYVQGAALPIAGKTALECIRELDLAKDQSLFIAGASGAIGTFVIQLATAKDIRVSASASQKNHDYLKSLGVQKAVDYNATDWKKNIIEWSDGGVEAALAIQPDTANDSIKIVKDGGKLITVSGDNSKVKTERNITVRQMGHTDMKEKFNQLVDLISGSNIKLVIEKEYNFEEALEALAKTETRHARGKLVVNGIK